MPDNQVFNDGIGVRIIAQSGKGPNFSKMNRVLKKLKAGEALLEIAPELAAKKETIRQKMKIDDFLSLLDQIKSSKYTWDLGVGIRSDEADWYNIKKAIGRTQFYYSYAIGYNLNLDGTNRISNYNDVRDDSLTPFLWGILKGDNLNEIKEGIKIFAKTFNDKETAAICMFADTDKAKNILIPASEENNFKTILLYVWSPGNQTSSACISINSIDVQ